MKFRSKYPGDNPICFDFLYCLYSSFSIVNLSLSPLVTVTFLFWSMKMPSAPQVSKSFWPFSLPRTKQAVDRPSESKPLSLTIVTEINQLSAGYPVDGSRM